jgi:hypothetical protein
MFKSLHTYIRFLPCLYFCYLWKAVALIWWKMVVLKVEIDGGYAYSLFKNHAVVIHFPLILNTILFFSNFGRPAKKAAGMESRDEYIFVVLLFYSCYIRYY